MSLLFFLCLACARNTRLILTFLLRLFFVAAAAADGDVSVYLYHSRMVHIMCTKLDTRKIHFVLKIIIYLILLIFPIFAMSLSLSFSLFFFAAAISLQASLLYCRVYRFSLYARAVFFSCRLSNCSFVLTRS